MTDETRQEYYKFRLIDDPKEREIIMFQKVLDIADNVRIVADCQLDQASRIRQHDDAIGALSKATYARDQAVQWHGRALTALWGFLGLSFLGMVYFVLAGIAVASR